MIDLIRRESNLTNNLWIAVLNNTGISISIPNFLQYLACLSSCSSNDKLAFDVGVQENNEGKQISTVCSFLDHKIAKIEPISQFED